MKDLVLSEAKRLHGIGFAIHWLHPKSKRPIESGWTTGPRKDWAYLKDTYQKGFNVGVRLGTPSKVKSKYLSVIDVDVKSKDPKHLKEVAAEVALLIKDANPPQVTSGRGNGSKHFYTLTDEPLKPFRLAQSKELIKVSMPSSGKPSKRDLEGLTAKEIEQGLRLRPAWEIGIMGDGQQVVLPPSIHPDSGKPYAWKKPIDKSLLTPIVLPVVEKPVDSVEKNQVAEVKEDFEVSEVEIAWLPTISDKIREMILTGEGVTDRSAMLLPIASALVQAGLNHNEVLSVLTDPKNFIGGCAYEHAKTNSRKRAAAWVYKYTLKKVLEQVSAEHIFRDPIVDEPALLTAEEIEKEHLEDGELRHWTEGLEITKDDKYRATLTNTVLILQNASGGEVWIRRDVFALRDFYCKAMPWGGKKDRVLVDDDIGQIKLWLGKNYGVEPSDNTISTAVTILAVDNSFDPAVDWLNSLPAWDETPRLDTWLKKNFGAEGNDEYLAQVFRKWVFAMVLRIFKPGAKFDWMPIFEGAQGVGKSSFGKILVGEKFFLDWLPDLNNKDSALALQGVWAVEMGELASFRKNEIETVKAFITRTVDKVRPPYGERWLETPRRCVFFGSTNYETYLRDDSGNRRFKPVKVGKLDFNQLEEDRNQLFAEAIWLYNCGLETERTLEIDGEGKLYERQIQSEKMVQDESSLMEDAMRNFIQNEIKKEADERFDFKRIRMQELFEKQSPSFQGLGPLSNWKFDSRMVQMATKALKNLGAEKWKSNGVKFWKLSL